LNVKLNVLVASMRPLLTLPSPLTRLGNGVGDAPLGSGGNVGGATPVVTVCGTVSSFVQVTVVPLVTSSGVGLKAKPLMLTDFGAAGLAQPRIATVAMSERPSTRIARRITTSDGVGVHNAYARRRRRDESRAVLRDQKLRRYFTTI
jgi:hypothetical protein